MKKDVYKYYAKQVDTYVSMSNEVANWKKLIAENSASISTDQLAYLEDLVGTMEVNLQRIAYIMYLLKLPLFGKARKAYEGKMSGFKTLFEKLGADENAVNAENDVVLAKMREFFAASGVQVQGDEVKNA